MTDEVTRAQREVTRKVMGLPGVAGTAQGLHRGKPCVKVYLERDDARLRAAVPRRVGSVPVRVEVTGAFRRDSDR